uniref:DUF3730 domain-containing protein n=1 Tax=Dracunculus medinensis TaxID=318479 RepID=A0A0N4UQX5_DRAME
LVTVKILSLICRIEWKQYVPVRLIKHAIKFISMSSFDAATLSDEQKALLIRTAGLYCLDVPSHERLNLTKKITQLLTKKEAQLGIAALNAILDVKIDNGIRINIVDALKKFESCGIKPNPDTFGIISRIYGEKGDIHLNSIGSTPTQQIFDSLIFGLSLIDQNKHAISLIKVFNLIFHLLELCKPS